MNADTMPRLDQFMPNMAKPAQAVAEYRFDADAWHVMQQRDNALIEQEILNGGGSSKFVYSFHNGSEQVSGVSVIGARHLAATYGGIKHKMIGSVTKTGKQMIFMTYPQPGMPMSMHCTILPELEKEPDFYTVLIEVTDTKINNVIQVEATEYRVGTKRDGKPFDRAHYKTIAQSKAFRNGVLDLIPQDLAIEWKHKMLALNKDDVITRDVLEEKRAGVMRYAAKLGVSINRKALETLLLDQIAGLADAAAEDKAEGFRNSAAALRIVDFGTNSAWDKAFSSNQTDGAQPVTGKAKPDQNAASATKGKTQEAKSSSPAKENRPASNGGWNHEQEPPREEQGRPITYPLISEHGEVSADCVSLLDWTKEFVAGLFEVPADAVDAYREHNLEYLKAAKEDPDCVAILAKAGEMGIENASEQDLAGEPDLDALVVQNPGGRMSDAQIVGLYDEALQAVHDEATMIAWRQANMANINSFHGRIKLPIYKALGARCVVLGIAQQGA